MTQPTDPSHCCRVCGLDQGEPPWGEDGKTPSFEICGCCGTDFGYQDCFIEGIKRARKEWLDHGGKWNTIKEKPIDGSLEKQLAQIPPEYQ
jgi:hypothetical protein